MANGEVVIDEAVLPVGVDPARVAAFQDLFRRSGALKEGAAFGLQVDLNAAWLEGNNGTATTASFCDHDCTTNFGGYDCPAASSRTIGIRPRTMAPAEKVIAGLETARAGIEIARTDFLEGPFQEYVRRFNIPPAAAAAMRGLVAHLGFEVNWFGGNAELFSGLDEVTDYARDAGLSVHLTTTGGRLMHGENFLKSITTHPPDVLAMSADDFTGPEQIEELARMSLSGLKEQWKRIPRSHGQERKAREAVHAAILARDTEGFPPILFNMVLHKGNIAQADDIMGALITHFPDVRINPFPAQSAFSDSEEPVLQAEHASQLCDFIDRMIAAQTAALREGGSIYPLVPRLPYWLMLRSMFDLATGQPEKAADMIAGNGGWTCYKAPEAGMYEQAGRGPRGHVRSADTQYPGGHLGCFWNDGTVTDTMQLWDPSMTPERFADYVSGGKAALGAAAVQAGNACRGCLFPRLTGHIISIESGMADDVLPHYLKRRDEAFGF